MSDFDPNAGTNDAVGTTLPAVSGASSPVGASGRAETVTAVENVEVTIEQKVTVLWAQVQSLAAISALHTGQIATLSGSAATSPPINQVAPTLSTNSPQVGVPMTVTTGTWQPPASLYSYVWLGSGSATALSVGANYTPVNSDLAHTLTCTVTASNAAGTTTVPITTAATNPVVAAGAATPPTFTASSPANVTVGSTYSYMFAASGTSPIAFSVSAGALPTGVTLNPTTGLISGTATTGGTFSFTMKATNTAGSATAPCTVTVTTAATSYNALIASLHPSLWLKLNESSGTVAADSSGNGFNGTYSSSGVTLGATNTAAGTGNDTNAATLTTGTITVPNHAAFTNLTTTAGTQWTALMWVKLGTGFTQFPWLMGVGDGGTGAGSTGWQIFCDGATPVVAFKAKNLQTAETVPVALTTLALVGVVWNGTQCQIWENGALAIAESETLGATVTDTTSPLIIGPTLALVNQVMIFPTALTSAQMSSIYNDYTTNSTPNAPAWGAVSPPAATLGVAYSYQFTASESPTSWAVHSGSVPAGLTFSTSTGLLSGTPTGSAATYTFVLRATNVTGFTDSPSISIVVSVAGATNIPAAPFGPSAPASGFRLIFGDDFIGSSLSNFWAPNEFGNSLSGPNNPWELANYDPANVSVTGGNAVIASRVGSSNAGDGVTRAYTAGAMSTGAASSPFLVSPNNAGTLYFEAKVKNPGSATGSDGGVFPAFWITTFRHYGDNTNNNVWTREMDFFEFGLQPGPGSKFQMDAGQQYPNAYGSGSPNDHNPHSTEVLSFDPSAAFHVYTAQVNSDGSFSVWLDGAHQWDFVAAPAIDWMGVVLNYAIPPGGTAGFPTGFTGDQMLIDYVAVWQDAGVTAGSGTIGGGLAPGTVHP